MKPCLSWTHRCEDGVKREVRCYITRGGIDWQFKRADQEKWDYDSDPLPEDWDTLEDTLRRAAGRGRAVNRLEAVQNIRKKLGV